VFVVGAKDADELLAPRHAGAIEDTRGLGGGVPAHDGVAGVAPQDALVSRGLVLPRHVRQWPTFDAECHRASSHWEVAARTVASSFPSPYSPRLGPGRDRSHRRPTAPIADLTMAWGAVEPRRGVQPERPG